jgi:hypothetical protein
MTTFCFVAACCSLASLVLVFHLLPDKMVTLTTKNHRYEYDSMAQVMAMSMTGTRTKRNATSNISFYGENVRMDDSTTERTRRAVEIRTRGIFSSVVSIGDSTATKPTQTHAHTQHSSAVHLISVRTVHSKWQACAHMKHTACTLTQHTQRTETVSTHLYLRVAMWCPSCYLASCIDIILPIGPSCMAAWHLQQVGLRTQALPFDWLLLEDQAQVGET